MTDGDERAIAQLRAVFGGKVVVGNHVRGRVFDDAAAGDPEVGRRHAERLLAQGDHDRQSTADWYRKLQKREE